MISEDENGLVEVFKTEDMKLPIQNLFDDLMSFISLCD